MTEKRFELIELYGDDHLIDNETNEKIGYDLHSPSTFNANWNNVCNLLNTLHEENQTFEKVYKDLKHKHHLLHDEYLDLEIERDDLKQAKKELIEENQELKKDIEYYKEERKALFEYLDKKDDLKLELRVDLND